MADADKILKLLVEMGVTGKEDVQAANDLLAETGKATGAAGAATSTLGAAEKEAAGSAEHLHLNHRALHTIMHMIGKETAPELGHALTGALYGPIGAALALGAAFEFLRKKTEEVKKQEEELNGRELEEHQSAVEMVQTAWDNCRQEVLKYDEAVKNAGQSKDPAADRLKQIEAISKAQTDAHVRELEELGRIEVASLKAHGGTPDQIAAAEARNKIEIENVKDRAARKSVADIRTDIDQRTARQSDYDATQAAEANRVGRANIDLDEAKGLKTRLTKNEPEIRGGVDKAQEAVDRLTKFVEGLKASGPETGEASDQLKRAQADLEIALSNQTRAHTALTQLEQRIPELEREKIAAEAALARVSAAGIANRETSTRERNQIPTMEGTEKAREEGQRVMALMDSPAGHVLVQLAAATGKSNEQQKNLFTGILNHTLNIQTVVAQLQWQLDQQAARMANMRNRTTG